MKFPFLPHTDKAHLQGLLHTPPQGKLHWDQEGQIPQGGTFILGDNLPVLQFLLPHLQEKVDLIYIDPPFGTGQAFASREDLPAYEDSLMAEQFLAFLQDRLFLLRECLSPRGSMFIHIDKKIGHYIRIIADEVFGYDNFINDITRVKCNPKNFARKAFGNYSDMILYYAKVRDQQIWREQREALAPQEVEALFPKVDPQRGRYTTHPLHAPGKTQNGDTGQAWMGLHPPKGRHWRYTRAELDRLEAAGEIEWSATGNPRRKVFARDHKGKKIQDVWTFKDKGLTYSEYPTQKNHDLLRRIILHASEPNSLVLDAFAGSGGTLLMAHELGRKWIGIDQSKLAKEVFGCQAQEKGIPVSWGQWKDHT